MDETQVQCPYCFEVVLLTIDPQTRGTMVEDCEICCRPWQVRVERDEEGEARVTVERS